MAVGNKLIAATADSWEPFENPEELKHIKGNVFKISKTDSFNSAEENVEFEVGPGGVMKYMRYAGMTMLPEDEYIKQIAAKSRIG